MFENPVEHTSIEVKPAIQINTSEALVVYKDCRLTGHTNEAEGKKAAAGALGGIVTMKDESITRRIFQGPALFVPHADEWVHKFNWTVGADSANDGNEVAKDSKFIKLQLNSQALAYTVTKVRTADEASLDIQLVAFVQLVDVDRMLDSSADPTRDLMQAISSDVFRFGGKHSLESLLERSSLLSDLENFPSLQARAEQMGFKISDILYRGYKTSSDLERMLDQTVTSRHKQRLAQEELVSEQRKAGGRSCTMPTFHPRSKLRPRDVAIIRAVVVPPQSRHPPAPVCFPLAPLPTQPLAATRGSRRNVVQELSRALQTEQDKFEAARASEKHEQQLLLQAKAFEQRLLLSAKQVNASSFAETC